MGLRLDELVGDRQCQLFDGGLLVARSGREGLLGAGRGASSNEVAAQTRSF
jgi:hypothetical protein